MINKIQLFNQITKFDLEIPNYTEPIKLTTSGFREKAFKLKKISFRVGLYLSGTSQKENSTYVVMVTASHNPPEDNGLKISNNKGQALSQYQMETIMKFANDKTDNYLDSLTCNQVQPIIFLGMDTRKSSPQLYELVKKGLSLFKCKIFQFGEVTTPQLYSYCFCFINYINNISQQLNAKQIKERFVFATIQNFKAAIDLNQQIINVKSQNNKKKWIKNQIVIDCADGVGGLSIKKYKEFLDQYFNIYIINASAFDTPNIDCGSQYIQLKKMLPKNFPVDLISKYKNNKYLKCVSFDGDGDRIVYYLTNSQVENPILLDGDRMTSVLFLGIYNLINSINKDYKTKYEVVVSCNLISNNGFFEFLRKKNIKVEITCIGITYLIEAIRKYDVGIYFQNSGHGSIYLSLKTYNFFNNLQFKTKQVQLLLILFKLCCNNERGDSFRNMLSFELLQQYLGLENDQIMPLYRDYIKIYRTIKVKNKSNLIVSKNQTEVISPVSLSQKIRKLKKQHQQIDIIIRPAKTQDLVRIHIQGRQISIIQTLFIQIQQNIRNSEDLN